MDQTKAPVRERIQRRIRRWPRRAVITIVVVALVLVAARLALPPIVKNRVNSRLQSIPGYTGQVADIDIHLWRGAYSLGGVSIFKQQGEVREPFVLARKIDFSVAWRELIHGKIVSDIYVEKGELTFVKGATEEESQKDTDRRWQQVIKDIFPIDITHFELRDGMVRYQDNTKQPNVDVFIKNMTVIATGLRNKPGEGKSAQEEFPAEIVVRGETLGHGTMKMVIQAEPLAAQPHFHLSAHVDAVNLPELNDSMKAIANVDVGKGTFQMAAEVAGKDGGFQGYIKPFFENLDFRNLEDKHKPLTTRLWEKMVSGLAWLVKNKARDQVGTRIPFEGRFGDPRVSIWTTIANTFRHGFIRAFNPTVEGTVHADNVRPDGTSADGKDPREVKDDSPKKASADDTRAGAPTGRPSEAKPKQK